MSKKESVYDAVKDIVSRRRAVHRYPECATRRELIDEIAGQGIAFHELTAILDELVQEGKLFCLPTISDQSYYLSKQ